MKKELSAALLFAALLTSCSAQQSSRSDESADTTASVSTAANTTVTTTSVAVTTETAAVTTSAPPRRTLHTDLCNTLTADDESNVEESINNISIKDLRIYSVGGSTVYEPTEEQKQIILDYIISHDLSPLTDGEYHFFPNQGFLPDESQLSFAITLEVPCVPADHRLVFSKDRTVVGVIWEVAQESGSYYPLEDAEQLAPIFDFAEKYAGNQPS